MGEYTLADAITDPDRPLTKSPDEWVTEVRQRRGSASTDVKMAAEEDVQKTLSDEEEIARVDSAVDSIISGIREFYAALSSLKKTNLTSNEREVFKKVMELLDTAVSPYVSDIVKELDKLEEE